MEDNAGGVKRKRTFEVDCALSTIEATAAVLLMTSHDDDLSSIRGASELLRMHGKLLHEAHDEIAACFEERASDDR